MNLKSLLKRSSMAALVLAMGLSVTACSKATSGGKVTKVADLSGYYYTNFSGEITDEDVKNYYLDLVETLSQYGYSSYEVVDSRDGSKVKKGDYVSMDFVTTIVGDTSENAGAASGYILKVGDGDFIQEVEDKMVGATVGETTTIEVTLPDDYIATTLAGKTISIEVTVNHVMQEAEVSAENAFYHFNYSDMDSFLEYIKTYLEQNVDTYEAYRAQQNLDGFVDYVVDNSEYANISVELNDRNVLMRDYFAEDAKKGGFTMESYAENENYVTLEAFFEYNMAQNERDIKAELAFAKIAEDKGYALTAEEFESLAYNQAIMAGYYVTTNESGADIPATIERFKNAYEKQHGEGSFETYINTVYYEQKAYDDLTSNS